MMLAPFHITIHTLPERPPNRKAMKIDDRSVESLQIDSKDSTQQLEKSFEQAASALEELPRMFFEPDGSFVWVSSLETIPWQLDGCLYDRQNRLQYVELKGTCPREIFQQLLVAIGCVPARAMFQLVRQAVFLDEENFLSLCHTSSTDTS